MQDLMHANTSVHAGMLMGIFAGTVTNRMLEPTLQNEPWLLAYKHCRQAHAPATELYEREYCTASGYPFEA
jgi:hypothetical protein